MNRYHLFALLSLSCALPACSHPPVADSDVAQSTTTTSTSSELHQCSTSGNMMLTDADCAARARDLATRDPAGVTAVPTPGTQTTTTGRTCHTVNGVTNCTAH